MTTQPEEKQQPLKKYVVTVLQTRWPTVVIDAVNSQEAMAKAKEMDCSDFSYFSSNDEWLIDSADLLEPDEL